MEIVAESLRSQVSPLYWPYDAVKDARVLEKLHDCPGLVDTVVRKVNNMLPSYTFAGAPVRIADVPAMFGIHLPLDDQDKGPRISYPVLRRRLRLHYPDPAQFYAVLLSKRMGRHVCAEEVSDFTYEDLCKMNIQELADKLRDTTVAKSPAADA